LREDHDTHPPERDSDKRGEPFWGSDPDELQQDRERRACPDNAEHDKSPVSAQHKQTERRVRAGDQTEDARMIDAPHPQTPASARPRYAVVQAAGAEHRGHTRSEHDRRYATSESVRLERHRYPERKGEKERHLMGDPAQAWLHPSGFNRGCRGQEVQPE
jgi:hypothetical protein